MVDPGKLTACLFSNVPAATFPTLPLPPPVTVDYEVIFTYKESTCALGEDSFVQGTCENGGILSVATELSSCSRISDSTIRCPIPREADGADVGGYLGYNFGGVVSCTGSSLSELALEVTWDPGSSGLSCVAGALTGSILQVLQLYQRCTTKSTELGPYADDVAVSCFPFSMSSPESISVYDVPDDDKTRSSGYVDGYTYEVCSNSQTPACYPDCEDEALSRVVGKIKPVHIDPDCLRSGEGPLNQVTVDGGGGGTAADISDAVVGGTGGDDRSGSSGGPKMVFWRLTFSLSVFLPFFCTPQ